jgi:quercetin dioxygenase-like cupin family protein
MRQTVPVVLGPGGGEVTRNPLGGAGTIKVRGMHSGGRVAVFDSVVPPGEGPPLHVHTEADEVLYVLEGTFRFQIDGELSEAPPDSTIFIPRELPHCFQNVGSSPGRLLIVFAPAGMERFFELTGGDPEAFEAAAAEVGMEVVGPPLR